MLFNSVQFFLFLAVFWSAHRRARTARTQNAILLVGSYIFYAAWDWRFLSLIMLSTLADFFLAQRLAASDSPTTNL